MAKLLLVLAAAVAVCAASSLREKRQVGFNCQANQNGPIPDQSDCSFFIDCYNGQGTRMACSPGLEFNPTTNYCDWPSAIPNPQCNRVSPSSARNAACAGTVDSAQVEHSEFCNAFMMCGSGYLYDGCFFCAAGQYFDSSSRSCISTLNVDTNRVCNGKRMIEPVNQEVRRLEGSCWPSNPNKFASLLAKIQQGGGFRPTNNRGFVSQ